MSMFILKRIIFYLPRISSITISTICFLFLFDSLSSNQESFAIFIGSIISIVIIFFIFITRKFRLLTLLPIGLWVYILLAGISCGIVNTLNIIQFIFLSFIVSTPMWISWYAWKNRFGGTIYIALAALYLFIAYGKINSLHLIIDITILVLTGIGIIKSKHPKISNISDTVNPTDSAGWKSLLS